METRSLSKIVPKGGWLALLSRIAPILIYTALTLPLFGWIVDDAGISFAYARNLAEGFGLVAQPGALPVEGYSNFLWVLIASVFHIFHLFDFYITPKIISLAMVWVTLSVVYSAALKISNRSILVAFLTTLILSVNASFIIWTCSGLENSLLALEMAFLIRILLSGDSAIQSLRNSALAGHIVVLMALTRPDAILLVVLYPCVIILTHIRSRTFSVRSLWRPLLTYSTVFAIGIIGFVLFRLSYFGEYFPNTYYVKGTIHLNEVWKILVLYGPYLNKFLDLVGSLSGRIVLFPMAVAIIFGLIQNVKDKSNFTAITTLVLSMFLTGFSYLVMPKDWMGEYRFATPFMIVLTMFIVHSLFLPLSKMRSRRIRIACTTAATAILVGIVLFENIPRLQAFQKAPVTPTADIKARYADRFDAYAYDLKISNGSLLLPDIGAVLYYSQLQVIDLAGLCDKTIARTMGNRLRRDQPAFHEYIFGAVKPTFIHTHGSFTGHCRLSDDPRFDRDYIAIAEYEDAYVKRVYKADMMSGNYVRRDAVIGKEQTLDSLQRGLYSR